jgi:hypothetical protein
MQIAANSNNGNCVQVATNLPGIMAVRDSKDPRGPALTFAPSDWQEFIKDIKAGRHDMVMTGQRPENLSDG